MSLVGFFYSKFTVNGITFYEHSRTSWGIIKQSLCFIFIFKSHNTWCIQVCIPNMKCACNVHLLRTELRCTSSSAFGVVLQSKLGFHVGNLRIKSLHQMSI